MISSRQNSGLARSARSSTPDPVSPRIYTERVIISSILSSVPLCAARCSFILKVDPPPPFPICRLEISESSPCPLLVSPRPAMENSVPIDEAVAIPTFTGSLLSFLATSTALLLHTVTPPKRHFRHALILNLLLAGQWMLGNIQAATPSLTSL